MPLFVGGGRKWVEREDKRSSALMGSDKSLP